MPVHACGCRCAREGTSSEADPARGRRGPSSEADPARGRRGPSSQADPARGRREPSSEADLIQGGLSPRTRRTSLEGALCWTASVGRGGRHDVDRVVCMFGVRPEVGFVFCVFAGFKQDSPRFFRGPSWLSPTVAPEHLRVYRSGSRKCWSLLIGCSSLPVANAFPWGRVSGPAGLAPEALQERECSCRGFLAELYRRRGTCLNRHRRCLSRLR
jgi:hypothetical protein